MFIERSKLVFIYWLSYIILYIYIYIIYHIIYLCFLKEVKNISNEFLSLSLVREYNGNKGFRILHRSIGQWKMALNPILLSLRVVFPLLEKCEQSKWAFLERKHV